MKPVTETPQVASPNRRGRGQPSKYNDRLATTICQEIARGVPVTKAHHGTPISQRTVYGWMHERPEFASAVQGARGHYRKMQAIRHYLRVLPVPAPVSRSPVSATQFYEDRLRS